MVGAELCVRAVRYQVSFTQQMVQCPIVKHQHLTNPAQSIIHCGAVTARRGTSCTMLHNDGEEFDYVENQLLIGASRGSHRQKPNDNKTPVLMTQ